MFHKPVSGLAGIALFLCCAALAPAQDFRVYTRIFDARVPASTEAKETPPQLLGRSTSLFHAGKVYDYLDSGHQMTIFEPAHERFVIVDDPRRQMTVITFEEIENVLYQAGKSAEKKIAELRGEGTVAEKKQAELLEFYIAPRFKEKFDSKKQALKMTSPFLSYEIRCATHNSAESIQAYLNYTDWAQRLNYLVNPRAMLPGPRLAVNEVLRRRELLPVVVTLHTRQRDGLHLRAEHRFDWVLDATDRKMITHWEKLMTGGEVKEVPFTQFFEPPAGHKTAGRK
jgi:hypothetical protein